MKNRRKQLILALAAVTIVSAAVSGCGQRRSETAVTETERQTEAVTEKITEKATEAESETQKLITSVDYTSKDGTIKITLPDNTWKVTQDADEMRVFSSGSAAMINIVHASTDAAMQSLSLMKTEDDLKTSLTKQYSDTTAYNIESFTNGTVSNVNTYRYVVKYNATTRMWACSVTYGIVTDTQAYVITGTVTDDNATLLASVEKAVDSFRVLKDETLKQVTSDVISGTTQKTTEVTTTTTSSAELSSLTDYGTTATLYANDIVNIRMQPGTDADVLGSLSAGDQVSVVGETSNWFKVNVNGNIGYIRKDFLVNSASAVTQTTETTASTDSTSGTGASSAELDTKTSYGSSTTLYASSDVNVRSQPGTDSSIIGGAGTGSSFTVIGETDNWFIVSVNGSTGYVSKSYLTSDSSVSNGTSADNGGTGNNNGGTDNGGTSNDGGGTTGNTGSQTITGTVVGSTADTVTVAGDDGGTYVVYTGEANVSTVDGIYDGVYVGVTVDNGQTAGDGTLYATAVNGY